MADTPHDRTEQLEHAPAAPAGCRLVVIEGPDEGSAAELTEGEAVIGCSSAADLSLSDTAVSSNHVRVRLGAAGIQITDLGSTNGTFYLGTRIQEAVVQPGAVLKMGRSRVAVRSRTPPGGELYSEATRYGRLIGSSPAMRRLYAVMERLEPVDYAVLVQGETGAGKELVAREIHAHSTRKELPFEILDCGAVPQNLAESELFGHARGAFTGAVDKHEGVFARARGGTVFLDEIGELPLELQPKLLRVLESKQFRPVGGEAMLPAEARVIAATHRDLSADVTAGRFREDLFFRLNVVTVAIPALRERREDIGELVRHLLADLGQAELQLSPDTLELFTSSYAWPGNVRELRNALLRVLSLGTVPENIRGDDKTPAVDVDLDQPLLEARKRLVESFERDYLTNQLERADNNLAQAARASGMDRSYFKRLLKRHGLLKR